MQYHAPIAGVAEWYTHTTQNRAGQPIRVRVSSPAQVFEKTSKDSKAGAHVGARGGVAGPYSSREPVTESLLRHK